MRLNGTKCYKVARLEDAFRANVAALKALVNVARDIRDCYADVIGTESCPGWVEDIDDALRDADVALRKADEPREIDVRSSRVLSHY